MKTQLAITFIVLMLVITVLATYIKRGRYKKYILIALSVTYVFGLLWFTLLSRDSTNTTVVALKPRAVQRFFQIDFKPNGGIAGVRIGRMYAETLRNILLFIPYGFLFPQSKIISGRSRKILKTILLGFSTSLMIEIIQLLMHLGWFDVDDIITNILGTIIGAGLYGLILCLTGLLPVSQKQSDCCGGLEHDRKLHS